MRRNALRLLRPTGAFIMTPIETSSFETIYNTTRRLPFSAVDAEQMRAHLQITNRNGLDLSIEDISDLEEMLQEGILTPRSYDLQTDFIFVNVDAGRGFFGGQKTKVLTFTSDIDRNQYFPGPVLSSLLRALVGINNLYRAAGLLKGPAL